ncbi:uncharacterized protein METZ01_LOCUS197638, partial [marine metagenome]
LLITYIIGPVLQPGRCEWQRGPRSGCANRRS